MTPETTVAPEVSPAKSKIRPFPWLCPKCQQEQVRMAVIPYRAESRRQGQMIAVDIPALAIPMCANCGELLFTDKVDRQIRNAFARVAQDCAKKFDPEANANIAASMMVPTFSDEDLQIGMTKETALAILDRLDATGSWDPNDYVDIDPHAEVVLRIMRWAKREDLSVN